MSCRRDVLIGGDLPCQKLRGASLLAHTQTNIQNKILKNNLNLGIIPLGGNAFLDGLGQTFSWSFSRLSEGENTCEDCGEKVPQSTWMTERVGGQNLFEHYLDLWADFCKGASLFQCFFLI